MPQAAMPQCCFRLRKTSGSSNFRRRLRTGKSKSHAGLAPGQNYRLVVKPDIQRGKTRHKARPADNLPLVRFKVDGKLRKCLCGS